MRNCDAVRLAKILTMTTSDTDSEALAAARRANQVISKLGLSWEGVLGIDDDQQNNIGHKEEAQFLLRSGKAVIDRFERGFLLGVLGFETLSEKQRAMLDQIKGKVDTALNEGGYGS